MSYPTDINRPYLKIDQMNAKEDQVRKKSRAQIGICTDRWTLVRMVPLLRNACAMKKKKRWLSEDICGERYARKTRRFRDHNFQTLEPTTVSHLIQIGLFIVSDRNLKVPSVCKSARSIWHMQSGR
jgi:hypothetical protein